MTGHPEIAIIDSNTLCCIGLANIIETLFPQATIRCFNTFCQLIDDTPDTYAHYFVASQIVLEHTAFFLERKRRTFVMTTGNSQAYSDFHTINVQQPEEQLIHSLIQLHKGGHPNRETTKGKNVPPPSPLSNREIEVLTLIVKGFINKEIAERLNISLTTVISHRKNLMEKTGIRTVSGLTIYAIMHGFVEVNQI